LRPPRDPPIHSVLVPVMEPISPELALIDPELRRADLARISGQPPFFVRVPAQRVAPAAPRLSHPAARPSGFASARAATRAPRAAAPASPPSVLAATQVATVAVAAPHPAAPRVARPAWARRAARVVLLAGLTAAGFLVANVAARDRSADRPVLLTGSTSADETPQPQPLTTLGEQGTVERKLLALVVQAPTKRLPAALVDNRTGLAKNNLQAMCRRASSGGYQCVVRPASHRPGECLYVRARVGVDGRTSFTWSSYRAGE
jgi:hypothetical protein